MSAMQTLTFACNLTSLNISLRKKVSKDNFEGHVGIPEESTAINWKFQNLVRILPLIVVYRYTKIKAI